MVPAADPDGDLCRRASAGDRAAFAGLYERHCCGTRAIVRRLCGDADDALQEAFVSAWQNLGEQADPADA